LRVKKKKQKKKKINNIGAQRAVPDNVTGKIPKININQYGEIVCEEWKNNQC